MTPWLAFTLGFAAGFVVTVAVSGIAYWWDNRPTKPRVQLNTGHVVARAKRPPLEFEDDDTARGTTGER